jgi:hypothetical protein
MTIEHILHNIDKRLESIEIQTQDNRKLFYKLIHQVDELVKFFNEPIPLPMPNPDINPSDMIIAINEGMEKLKNLEEELQKCEKNLTPGIVGEA